MMPVKLFFSYSHHDEALRDQLEVHLTALKRQGQIDTWHDRRITPGDDIGSEISSDLEDARIILLLVSPEFVASDYCYGIETARALERHEAREARVIPVILRACDWHDLPFADLLALPTDGKPITSWANIDEAFLDVVRGIKSALSKMGTAKAGRPNRPQQTIPYSTSAPAAHPRPRSSNLRIAKSFSDQERDDFLHRAFSYLERFFENSLDELGKRNPGFEGRFRRLGENRFTATIYQGGSRVSCCTVYIRRDFGESQICFADREVEKSNTWNKSLSVGHDEQTLFLEPLGMMGFGGQEHAKLSMQGGAELFWGAFIMPLQGPRATRSLFYRL